MLGFKSEMTEGRTRKIHRVMVFLRELHIRVTINEQDEFLEDKD